MKPILTVAVVAALFAIAPNPCFAIWGIHPVTKESAKELGFEFRTVSNGDTDVRVEMEFKPEGKLKAFSRVDMQIGADNEKWVLVSMKEDRSKEGRVVVSFSASRDRLDKISLRVMISGGVGGVIYEVPIKDFVAPK